MSSAIFVASSTADALSWAKRWGYETGEVIVIRPQDKPAIESLKPNQDVPCFVCRPSVYEADEERLQKVVDLLQLKGFTVFDAEELSV